MTRKAEMQASLPVLEDASSVLDRDDRVSEMVEVPEWGVQVRVVSLTGSERDALERGMLVEKRNAKGVVVSRDVTTANLRAKMVAASARKPDGTPVFTAAQAGDLGMKNASALDRIFRVAQRLSAMTDDDVEELVEDFGSDQSGGSGSD